MFKIKLFNKISASGLSLLDPSRFTCADDIEGYDGILVRSAALHDTVFPESLKAIARAGAGVNNIPVDACSEAGIVVFNTPGANANAVKELVIASLLLSSRKITDGIEWAKTLKGQGADIEKAVEKGKGAFTGPEIEGKTLGIIGLGAIGVMVANAAHNLGMNVLGYDPYISVDAAWGLSRSIKRATSLKDIYTNCDYITIHVPLNSETKGMINSESISSMKKGVRLLNFSRGGLVNTDDMKEALTNGSVACYVTDFPSEEVLALPNCIAIPHLGASTPESEENCAVMAAKEISSYLIDGNIKNSVNFPNAEMPRSGDIRLCIIHKNVPNKLSQISSLLGQENINIENMLNKSKGQYAYTIIDIIGECPDKVIASLKALPDCSKVRVIR